MLISSVQHEVTKVLVERCYVYRMRVTTVQREVTKVLVERCYVYRMPVTTVQCEVVSDAMYIGCQ